MQIKIGSRDKYMILAEARKIVRLSALLLLVLALSAAAQHEDHDHSIKPGIQELYERFQKPQVTYQLQATVDPRAGTIKGWMDISWENQTDQKLSSVALDLGFSPYGEETRFDFYDSHYGDSVKHKLTVDRATFCWIDSILCRAARLKSAPVMKSNLLLDIEIPHGLNPGEKLPLIVFFETKYGPPADSSLWQRIDNWFPQIAHYDPEYFGGKFWSTKVLPATADHPFAQYSVSLTIDSSFSLIAPGDLINEKEHYGTLAEAKPDNDTVFVDVTSSLYAFERDRAYQPEFKNGLKQYHFRLLNGNNFPILIANKFRLDRTFVENVPIEIYYREAEAENFSDQVARIAREVLTKITADLGPFPYPKLMITSVDSKTKLTAVREMISLPNSAVSEWDIRRGLILLLSQCWFADILPAEYQLYGHTPTTTVDEAFAVAYWNKLLRGYTNPNGIGPAERTALRVRGGAEISASIDMQAKLFAEMYLVFDMNFLQDVSAKFRFRIARMKDINSLIEKHSGNLHLLKAGEERPDRPSWNINGK